LECESRKRLTLRETIAVKNFDSGGNANGCKLDTFAERRILNRGKFRARFKRDVPKRGALKEALWAEDFDGGRKAN
jgi:hypothetical protein